MLNSALAVLHDEHRSIAAVIHGLRYVNRDVCEGRSKADFKLLWAMIFYLEEFPEKVHHPKEEAYLFAKLRQRTSEADAVVCALERQHLTGAQRLRNLELSLSRYEAGAPDGLNKFCVEAEKFAEEGLQHMALEESTVIPLAKKYLTAEDWVEIGAAFGENGDPRFDVEADQDCRELFRRIINLAPPPIGVGPAKG